MDLFLIDKYSSVASPVHRINPTINLISFLGFVVIVVLVPAGSFTPLVMAFLSLSFVIVLSRVPMRFIFVRSLVIIPFVIAIAAFNLLAKAGSTFFHEHVPGSPMLSSAGTVVFLSIVLKSLLCVLAMTLLVSTMGSARLLSAMRSIGVPSGVGVVACFLSRYFSVVVSELLRMKRARDSRRGGKLSRIVEFRSAGTLVGVLFIRSYERAERIYGAMCSRGFDGKAPVPFQSLPVRSGTSRTDFLLPVLLLCPLLLSLIVKK